MSQRAREPAPPKPEPPFGGIAPVRLLGQVKNTAGYWWLERDRTELPPPVAELLSASDRLLDSAAAHAHEPDLEWRPDATERAEYFALCLSAHYTTVGTFVPTDVDIHIRHKLWHAPTAPATRDLLEQQRETMGALVLEAHGWDPRPLSNRWVAIRGGDRDAERVAGHTGEWFSVAAAALGVLDAKTALARELAERVVATCRQHAQWFERAVGEGDELTIVNGATLIAHNLGDLARVQELSGWSCPELVEASTDRWLTLAGTLNRELGALENHRHLPLRAHSARSLRRSQELVIGLGPLFDDWGERVARHPALDLRDVAGVTQALIDGWERLKRAAKPGEPAPLGYGRALAGILRAVPGGFGALRRELTARTVRLLEAGELRAEVAYPRARFEEQWRARVRKCLERAGHPLRSTPAAGMRVYQISAGVNQPSARP